MKKLGYIASLGVVLALPVFALAQSSGTTVNNIQDLAQFVIDFINNIAVPLVFAIAFIVFIWGVFQYFILGGHDEEKREAGKSLMLWGLIGFAVMVSVWGLVHILTGTLNLDNKLNGNDLPSAVNTSST